MWRRPIWEDAMSKLLLGLSAACVIAAGALATGGLATAQAPGMSPDSAAKFIAVRQAGLDMSAVTLGSMFKAPEGTEAKAMGFQANALSRWSQVLPTLFPAGTGAESGAKTRALPTIWSDRPGFDKAAADYQAATAKLLEMSKANDTAGFKAQLKAVDATCDACHAVYRAKPAGH
jgi:cytochrome c556